MFVSLQPGRRAESVGQRLPEIRQRQRPVVGVISNCNFISFTRIKVFADNNKVAVLIRNANAFRQLFNAYKVKPRASVSILLFLLIVYSSRIFFNRPCERCGLSILWEKLSSERRLARRVPKVETTAAGCGALALVSRCKLILQMPRPEKIPTLVFYAIFPSSVKHF